MPESRQIPFVSGNFLSSRKNTFSYMSWLKGAFDKVRDKGSVVKEIARDIAHRTKEVRSRLIGASSASELEVPLTSVVISLSIGSTRSQSRFTNFLPGTP